MLTAQAQPRMSVDGAWPGMVEQFRIAQRALGVPETDPPLRSDKSLAKFLGTLQSPGVYHAVQHDSQMCSANFHGVKLVYVQNYKVNTQGICSNLYALNDHGHEATSTFSFTIVRDPLSRFTSGYSEISYRAGLHKAGASFSRRPEGFCSEYLATSESDPARAAEFIKGLISGRLGHRLDNTRGCTFFDPYLHVLPQVGFVVQALHDHNIPIRGLDFLGKLEHLNDEWERLGNAVRDAHGISASWPRFDANLWADATHPDRDSNPHTGSDADSGSDARANMASLVGAVGSPERIGLCRVFLPDFVCFNYTLPADCAAALEGHGVTCAWPLGKQTNDRVVNRFCSNGPNLGRQWPMPPTECPHHWCGDVTAYYPSTVTARQLWAPYLSAVYGEAVDANEVDLKQVGWFYWSPMPALRGLCLQLFDTLAVPNSLPLGKAFVAANYSGVPLHYGSQMQAPSFSHPTAGMTSFTRPKWCQRTCAPAHLASAAGFFVKVAPLSVKLLSGSRIEVMHVNFAESGVAWFYHTPGSGVFIDLDALRMRGRLLELQKREDWNAHGRGVWHSARGSHKMHAFAYVHALNALAEGCIVCATGFLNAPRGS